MIKAVLFDMDGVLIDSHDAWFYIFNKTYNKFEGKTITVKEFDRCLWAKAFDKIAKRYFTVSLKKIRECYRELYDDYKKRIKIMKNAKKTVSALKEKGLKIGIVSNTQRGVVKKILKDVGLAEFFDLFLGGDDVIRGKPAPDMVLKALKLLKLKKDEVVLVGDTKWDKKAAEKAGVKFIGFRTKKGINDLTKLLELV